MSAPPIIMPPDLTKSATIFENRLQLLLVGDSLTQRGSEPDGWATMLSHYYSRKSDTCNRGFSGYNSNHVRAMMEQHIASGIWPSSHAATPADAPKRQTLLTLCVGANDSCLKDGDGSAQHVPLDQFRANLAAMLTLLKGADGKSTPDLHVIVVGPPQTNDLIWSMISKQRHGLSSMPVIRDNAFTAEYAAAAASVTKEFGLPYIDMYAITSDWSLLIDGLHYTRDGNHLLFTQLLRAIEEHYPQLSASAAPLDSPWFQAIPGLTLEEARAYFAELATNTP